MRHHRVDEREDVLLRAYVEVVDLVGHVDDLNECLRLATLDIFDQF